MALLDFCLIMLALENPHSLKKEIVALSFCGQRVIFA